MPVTSFIIDASDPRSSGDYDSTDTTLPEAIYTVFPLEAADAVLHWGSEGIPLSYRYDVATMIDDVIGMAFTLHESEAGEWSVEWPSNTFSGEWSIKWSGDDLSVEARWREEFEASGYLESHPVLKTTKASFLSEWGKLTGKVLAGLAECGYGRKELPDMTLLIKAHDIFLGRKGTSQGADGEPKGRASDDSGEEPLVAAPQDGRADNMARALPVASPQAFGQQKTPLWSKEGSERAVGRRISLGMKGRSMDLYKNGFVIANLDTRDGSYEAWPLASREGDAVAESLGKEADDSWFTVYRMQEVAPDLRYAKIYLDYCKTIGLPSVALLFESQDSSIVIDDDGFEVTEVLGFDCIGSVYHSYLRSDYEGYRQELAQRGIQANRHGFLDSLEDVLCFVSLRKQDLANGIGIEDFWEELPVRVSLVELHPQEGPMS
jgi:hypothetical protein